MGDLPGDRAKLWNKRYTQQSPRLLLMSCSHFSWDALLLPLSFLRSLKPQG